MFIKLDTKIDTKIDTKSDDKITIETQTDNETETVTKKRRPKQPKPEKHVLNFENFNKHKIVLNTYKIPQLKDAAKNYRLRITGSKLVLIARITEHFNKINNAITIQKTFRRHIVVMSFKIRGPAFENRTICLNDTDFVTMEPLDEIPRENFFSYKDKKDFVYGFNISSLIQVIKKSLYNRIVNVINPYNREQIPSDVISKAITLYRVTYIIYPEFRNENETFLVRSAYRRYTAAVMTQQRNRVENDDDNENDDDEERTPRSILQTPYRPRLVTNYTTNQDNYTRYNTIQQNRLKPVENRITELFIEIDQLGNYTNREWFSSLDLRCYNRLYRCIYEIWGYRGGLTYDVKIRICPFHGPFDGIFTRTPRGNELSLEQMRLACLIVMENLVYSGIDEDHRKIGCFHALSALTVVSNGAREAMPWLYDSVIY